MKREWTQKGSWHFYGDDGAAVVWASYKSADLYKGGQRSPLRYAGPTALADAKAAAEKALTPVDPLDAEAERLGLRWDGDILRGDFGNTLASCRGEIMVHMVAERRDKQRAALAAVAVLLGKDKPTEPVAAMVNCQVCGSETAKDEAVSEIQFPGWRCRGCYLSASPPAPTEPAPETPIDDSPEGFARRVVSEHSGSWYVGIDNPVPNPTHGCHWAGTEWYDDEAEDARRGIAAATKERDKRMGAKLRAVLNEDRPGDTLRSRIIVALDAAGL